MHPAAVPPAAAAAVSESEPGVMLPDLQEEALLVAERPGESSLGVGEPSLQGLSL